MKKHTPKLPMKIHLQIFQLVLFRAITIQVILAQALLIFPMALSFCFMVFGFRWLPKAVICIIMVTATHTLCDFITITYFVKVYRIFFLDVIRFCLLKIGIKFEHSITPLPAMTSTSGTSGLFRV